MYWLSIIESKTVKHKFSVPVITDILDRLGGAQWFTKLDLMSGYHQIRLNPADKPKTGFSTHWGLHQFWVITFGLENRFIYIILPWEVHCLFTISSSTLRNAQPQRFTNFLTAYLSRYMIWYVMMIFPARSNLEYKLEKNMSGDLG